MRRLCRSCSSGILTAWLCTSAMVTGLSPLGFETAHTRPLPRSQIAAFKGLGQFGLSVAITGATVFAGSTNKVDIFAEADSRWGPDGSLEGAGALAHSGFGAALSASGSTLLVGAADQPGGGRVYAFTDRDGNWGPSSVLKAPRGSRGIRVVGRDQRSHGHCGLRSGIVRGTRIHIPRECVGQMGAPR